MNTQPNDGGPAFPCHTNPLPGKLANAPQGMTLRDYFAGQALAGLLASSRPGYSYGTARDASEDAYRHADAMLAARERKEGA